MSRESRGAGGVSSLPPCSTVMRRPGVDSWSAIWATLVLSPVTIAFCSCSDFGTLASACRPEAKTLAYCAPSVPTPVASRWSIEVLWLPITVRWIIHPPTRRGSTVRIRKKI